MHAGLFIPFVFLPCFRLTEHTTASLFASFRLVAQRELHNAASADVKSCERTDLFCDSLTRNGLHMSDLV
jgi:hypothetical protein